MSRPGASGRLAAGLDVAAAAAFGVAAALTLTGGRSLDLASFVVRLHDPLRPLMAAGLLGALRLMLSRSRPSGLDLSTHLSIAGFSGLIGFLTTLWIVALVTTCGGSDSYGYVSAARLLTEGRLVQTEPLARALPFDGAMSAAAPLAYQPTPDGRGFVPIYPLGLPLVMALFQIVLGPDGPFLVAPILGGLLLVSVYHSARGWLPPVASLLAVTVVAAHPVVLNQAIQPMSDVPAAFWVVAALVLVRSSDSGAIFAGLAAGMAVLTRPALLVPAAILAGVAGWRHGLPGVWRFAGGLVPCLVAQAFVNQHLYGSALVAGYGSVDQLFSVSRIGSNAFIYAKWLTIVHTPLFFVFLAAGLLAAPRAVALPALGLFAGVLAPYLAYTRFDDWEMLRFLLPGLVPLLVLSAGGFAALAARWLPGRLVPPALVAAGLLAAGLSFAFLDAHRVFVLHRAEARYRDLGSWIAVRTAPTSVVLASLHSGSLRHYSGRRTLRWDRIPPDRFAETVAALAEAGADAYLVLDGPDEERGFAARFDAAERGRVDMGQAGPFRGIAVQSLRAR